LNTLEIAGRCYSGQEGLLDKVPLVQVRNFLTIAEPVNGALWNALNAACEHNIWLGVEEAAVLWQRVDKCWRDLDLHIGGGHGAVAAVVQGIARVLIAAMQRHGVDYPLGRHDVLNELITAQPVEACRLGISAVLDQARERHALPLDRHRRIHENARIARLVVDVQQPRRALLAPAR
jgi:hypothetical protein